MAVVVARSAGERALRAEVVELRARNAELRRGHGLLTEQVAIQQELIATQRRQIQTLTEQVSTQQELIGTQDAQIQTLDRLRGLLEEENRRLAERLAELGCRLPA